jgi:hypothetical protein
VIFIVIKIAIDKKAAWSENRGMKELWLCGCLLFGLAMAGCSSKKPQAAATPPPPAAPPPVRSQLPPPSAETIEHCVITKQENANTVTCSCVAVSTKIDSKTGHTTLICKKMKEEQ